MWEVKLKNKVRKSIGPSIITYCFAENHKGHVKTIIIFFKECGILTLSYMLVVALGHLHDEIPSLLRGSECSGSPYIVKVSLSGCYFPVCSILTLSYMLVVVLTLLEHL